MEPQITTSDNLLAPGAPGNGVRQTRSTGRVKGKVRALTIVSPEIKSLSDGGVRISGLANTPNIDRYREVIEIGAFAATLGIYLTNPIMLLQHDPERPIGTFDQIEIRPDGLWVSGVVKPGTLASNEAITLIKNGVLRTFSVGFRELDGEYDENGIYHITQLELYEISVVSIPANRESIFVMDEGGKLLRIEFPDEDDASMRLVLRRLRRVLAARAADALADDAQLVLACRLIDVAVRRIGTRA